MNFKIVATLVTLLCLALASALVYRHSTALKDKTRDVATIVYHSNQWVDVSRKLEEQKLVNLSLERDFVTQSEELKTYSNNLASLSADFVKIKTDAKQAADAAKEQLRQRDARITELEGEREGLTQKMNDLTGSITGLETRIAETQRMLEASEGDREFLLKELKRLQAEKSDLERQFNDLAMLREQVHRLRDELSVSRRLEWLRRGLYGSLKGSEILKRGLVGATPAPANYNLDVEIRRDGGATILTNTPPDEPTGVTTNAATFNR